jgi:N-acetylglucosamine-6-phosphate deacetylase
MRYIDLHTHGIAGYDTRSTEPDDYLAMADAFLSHGTGSFLPTLFPGPVNTMRAQMAAVKRAMELQGTGNAARILGVHLEGPFVNPDKAGALGRESFLPPDVDSLMRLVEGYGDVVRIITIAPELPGALGVIEKAASMGIRVNMGHSSASFAQADEGRRAGADGVTHLFNAMSGLHHREPGLAGYALTDDSLYVELIADFAHVHPDIVKLVIRCKPPERVILVSDSLGPAKTNGVPDKGPLYMPGGQTLAGSGITLSDAVENLLSIGADHDAARRFASDNPAEYIGLDIESL